DLNGTLTGWNAIGSVTYDANEDQTNNNPTSGVAIVGQSSGNAGVLAQCVNLPLFWRSVAMRASYFTRTATGNGTSFAQLQFFKGYNCSGAFLSTIQQNGVAASTFQPISFTGLTIPIDAQSALVTFGALSTDPTDTSLAAIDTFFFGYDSLQGTCGDD